jgi:hypothetical protein
MSITLDEVQQVAAASVIVAIGSVAIALLQRRDKCRGRHSGREKIHGEEPPALKRLELKIIQPVRDWSTSQSSATPRSMAPSIGLAQWAY